MTAVSALVLEHVRNPRNAGRFEAAELGILSGQARDGEGLDRVELYLRVRGEHIEAARFRASGCPALIASASRFTERVSGLSRPEAAMVTAQDLAAELGLPSHQVGKAGLVVEAFVEASAKWDDAADERAQDPG